MNPALRKRRIAYSARKVFSQKGYHAATVDDIIRDAGVSRGTFYKTYRNKRELLGELLDSLMRALEMNMKRVDVSPGAPTIVDQMMGNVERILTTLTTNLDLTRILLRGAVGIDPDFDRKLDEFYESTLALIELSLKNGQDMGIVRPCNVEIASCAVLGALRQAMEVFLTTKSKRTSSDVLGKNLLDVLANGLFVRTI